MKLHTLIKASAVKSDSNSQFDEIKQYIKQYALPAVSHCHLLNITPHKGSISEQLENIINFLENGDILIGSHLAIIGRSLNQLTNFIHNLLTKGIRVIFINEHIDMNPKQTSDPVNMARISMFSLFAALERDLIHQRIKDSISTKRRKGSLIGRKPGATIGSKYDIYGGEIIKLLNTHGEKWTKILALIISYAKTNKKDLTGTRQSLATWVEEKCEKGLGDLWRLKGVKK